MKKNSASTFARYNIVILTAALLMPCALFAAKTTTADVPAGGGKWSAFSWSNDAPVDGDTVILNNNNSSPVTIENDTADTLAAIFVGGQSGVTITGCDLELTGDSAYKITGTAGTWSWAISNEVPLIVDVPVAVSANSFWHFRNDLTLNRDVSVADGEELCLYRHIDDCRDSNNSVTIFYDLTFNGHLHATNATLISGVYQKNNVIFKKSMHVNTNKGIANRQDTYFKLYASSNTWTSSGTYLSLAQWHLHAVNAHDPAQPMIFGAVETGALGLFQLYADQEVTGLSGGTAPDDPSKNLSAGVKSQNYSTLYVRANESRTAYCQLGSYTKNDAAGIKLNVNFSATSDDIVQTLAGRYHTMTGSLVVCSGTLRTEGNTRFLYLPTLTLSGGKFQSASTATDTVFPALERLHIASNARFEIESTSSPFAADTTVLSVENGGKIKVPSGMTVCFKAAFIDGSFVASKTYTASNCNWIEGDGSVEVSIPENWNVWKAETGGLWSTGSCWSKGAVPTATDVAVILASKNNFTVTADSISTPPSQIKLWGVNGKNATLVAGVQMSLSGHKIIVSDGGILSIPEGSSVSADSTTGFTVENGGEVSVAGSFAGKELSATVRGKLYVTGSFAVTNKTSNLFKFYDGADIEINGGLFRGDVDASSAYQVFQFNANNWDITFTATNGATVDLWRAIGATLQFYNREFTLSGNSTFRGGMTFGQAINGDQNIGLTNTVNVIDGATLELNDDTDLSLGYHTYAESRTVVMNIDTDKTTVVPSNVSIGRGGRGVLNIDGGHKMTFNGVYGFSVPRGVGPDHRSKKSQGGGEVNIINGTISSEPYTPNGKCLTGFNIASWSNIKTNEQDVVLSGVMNIFKDGNVQFNTNIYGNANCYFIVGCGLLADGEVNVYGGKIDNISNLNPLVGQWAGKGAINVHEGGYVYMKETMYVGGSFTNDLVSFKRGFNGGANFDQYFPLDNTTGEGVINVEDGTFVAASAAVFSVAGTGSLSIGTNGLFVANNVCLSNSVNSADSSANVSTLSVKFGETTAGKVVCGTVDEETKQTTIDGTLTVGKGAKLVVDASALTEPESRYIPLVQFATMEGSFAESNIELIKPSNNSASNWSVVRTMRNGVDGYYLNASKSGFILIVR